jgi:uncharacterized protein
MVLADTNIWLALTLSKHAFHDAAKSWLLTLAASQRLAFCRATQQSYLRLLTTGAVLAPYGLPPLTNEEAWDTYVAIIDQPHITWLNEPRGLDKRWKHLSGRNTASPKLWMDAYLAAFAILSDAILVTSDQAFTQFAGLECHVLERA